MKYEYGYSSRSFRISSPTIWMFSSYKHICQKKVPEWKMSAAGHQQHDWRLARSSPEWGNCGAGAAPQTPS